MNGNNLRENLLENDERINNLRKDQYFPTYEQIQSNQSNFNNTNSSPNISKQTLNESVWSSLERDLTRILLKLKVVIVPYINEEKIKELKQWDLWGPFVMCLVLGLILSLTSKKDSGVVFTTVFILIWFGSLVITINTKLLGGKMSLMQCICLLGYCLFPLDIAALLVRVFFSFLPGIFKLFIVGFTFMWSTKASVPFISDNISQKKKLLAVYPVMLFFIYLNYFILV